MPKRCLRPVVSFQLSLSDGPLQNIISFEHGCTKLTLNESKRTNMDVAHLNFKGSNPGAVRYGNFINYYEFHPPQNRLKVLPTDIWKWDDENPVACLDIGCNAGDLTVCLHDRLSKLFLNECHILAIDLDPTLIKRAKEKNSENIEFQCLDFTDQDGRKDVLSSYLNFFKKRKFDVVFCFSITMWIHLNKGDEGLRIFLQELCEISDMIVIEPQPWKCYKAAVKRLKLSSEEFPNFKYLKLKKDVEMKITEIILSQNFYIVAETERTDWGRKLLIFKNKLFHS